jgi:lambda family phage portal protein
VNEPKKTTSWSQRFDSVIGFFSPKRQARREYWREAQENMRRYAYRSALHSRLGKGRVFSGSADFNLEQGLDREIIVDRCREAERNNVIAAGLITRAVENVIGCGIKAQAESDDDAWNVQAMGLWNAWCHADQSDVRGIDDFYSRQKLTFRSYLRDGDVGTVLVSAGSRRGMLQSVESDEIASPVGETLSARMVDGVELDRFGRPIRFHIVQDTDTSKTSSIRDGVSGRKVVNAEDFLFLARRGRLNQTRGMPALAQGIKLLEQIDGNIEAVSVAVRMAACFGLVIESGGVPEGLPNIAGGDGKNYSSMALEPGMVKHLDPGDSIQQIKPEQPTGSFSDLVALLSRLVGIPLSLPLELVLLDFSKTSYSSARASLLQAYRAFRCHQQDFVAQWCRPIYLWKVREWVDSGLLPQREDWKEHSWLTPSWEWVDPLKEMSAHALAVDYGFSTVSGVVRSMGNDFDQQVAQRGREIAAMEAAGIPLVQSTHTRAAEGLAPEEDEDEVAEREEQEDYDRQQRNDVIALLEERRRSDFAAKNRSTGLDRVVRELEGTL